MSGELVVLLVALAAANSASLPAWQGGAVVQAPKEVLIRGRPYTNVGAAYPGYSNNAAKLYQPTPFSNPIKRHNVEVTRHQALPIYPNSYSQGFRQIRDFQAGHGNEAANLHQITEFKSESIIPEIQPKVKNEEINPKPEVIPAKPSESTAKPPQAFFAEIPLGKSDNNINNLNPEINPAQASESTAKPVLLPKAEILGGESQFKVNDPVMNDNYRSPIAASRNYGSFQSSMWQ